MAICTYATAICSHIVCLWPPVMIYFIDWWWWCDGRKQVHMCVHSVHKREMCDDDGSCIARGRRQFCPVQNLGARGTDARYGSCKSPPRLLPMHQCATPTERGLRVQPHPPARCTAYRSAPHAVYAPPRLINNKQPVRLSLLWVCV